MAARLSSGQTIPPGYGRTTKTFKRLARNLRAERRPRCCLCGQGIDYTLAHPDPNSFSVQHIKSREQHPELAEEPTNLDAAHLGCNSSAGIDGARPSLGNVTGQW